MAQRISDVTLEHLDGGNGLATEATLAQFKRACDAAIHQHQAIFDWNEDGTVEEEGVTEYVWNDGRFDVRVRELLGEEVAY